MVPCYSPSKTVQRTFLKDSCILTLTEVISIRILRMRLISTIMNFYLSHAIPLQKLSNEHSYKFSWILTLTEVISIRIMSMRLISAIMNFYWSHTIALQKLSNEHSYKFSWILTLTEVISIRITSMRLISAIMNFYWSYAIPLQKLSNERSYKFSWILTLTEVMNIRNLRFFARLKKWRPLNSANAAEPKGNIKKLIKWGKMFWGKAWLWNEEALDSLFCRIDLNFSAHAYFRMKNSNKINGKF